MLLLVPITLLLITALALVVLRVLRPQFRYGWLMAVGLTGAAWVSSFASQPRLPLFQSLSFWRATTSLSAPSALSLSGLSWTYSLCLLSLVLATLLTAPAREGFPNPTRWATCIGIGGLGLLAVASNDSLTLVLFWAALDLAEIGLLLKASNGEALTERAVSVFSVRLVCIALVLLEFVLGSVGKDPTGFASTSAEGGLLLLAAAAFRLAMHPVRLRPNSDKSLGAGVEATMDLTSAVASLALLSRIPSGSLASPVTPVLILLCAAAAIYSGWMWLRAPDEVSGRAFGIKCVASLAVAAALRGNPAGATAWGAALVLAGGALFLSSVQHGWLNRAILIGAWTLSSLPFSLTATAWLRSSSGFDWAVLAFLVAQAMLLSGFVRQVRRTRARPAFDAQAAWVKGVYPAGIAILLVGQVLLAAWGWDGALKTGAWTAGLGAAGLALMLLWAAPRIPTLSPVPDQWLPEAWGRVMQEVGQEGQRGFHALQRAAGTLAELLEGESGIMWSLLVLALFVSLIIGGKP